MSGSRQDALLLAFALAVAARGDAGAQATPNERTLAFGRFGEVHLYLPRAQSTGVALFLSGDGGWNRGVVDMARELADGGALVVGVDVTRYLKQVESSRDPCAYPAGELEALSQWVQRETGQARYSVPVLVGYSSGATLAYAALVQAPTHTFRGAVSLGFCPDLPVSTPMCRGQGLEFDRSLSGGSVVLRAASALETPWVVLQGTIDQVCDGARTAGYVRGVPSGEVVMLPGVGHGFSVQRRWAPALRAAFAKLAARPMPIDAPRPDTVADLPLVEVPATPTGAGDHLAVIVSGDGGWASLDRQLGAALAAHGVPVVGLDALQYLWERKTPERAGSDLARILRHYLGAWRRRDAIVVGYSRGADVLPFAVARLPAELRERVALVALLGPARSVEFEFHVTDWLSDSARPAALQIRPEVEKLRGLRVLCVFGKDERESLCRELDPTVAELVERPGGHHFDGDYEWLANRILQSVDAGR